MKFKYQAKTREGEMQTGFVEGDSRETAVNILTGHNLFILSLEEAERYHWYDRIVSYFYRVKSEDMVVMSRQLAILLQARLPLDRALAILETQTTNMALKQALGEVAQDIEAGLTFYQSLEKQKHIFSEFFVSMIRSAEVTGNLDEVSGFLADYIEREDTLATKAKSALIYPGIIVLLFVAVVFLMITVVFPQIQPIFEQSGIELPFFSQLLIDAGTFVSRWWFVIAIVFSVLIAMVIDYFKTKEGRGILDEYKLRLPIVKKFFVPITLARFSNAAGMLIKGGVPIAQAMEIVGETVDNLAYRDIFHEIAEAVRQGQSLSQAFAKYEDYFPPMVSQMVAVGEKTGRLNEILDKISVFYMRSADSIMSNMVDIIQPVLMIVIGVLVALLFASILLPLYKLTLTIQ